MQIHLMIPRVVAKEKGGAILMATVEDPQPAEGTGTAVATIDNFALYDLSL